jgi:TPR repeat protein
VTNSGNNASDPKEQSSELNPLQNPTLGRNLGRWAQVYFTNPPEKREQAVVELLRELEKGASGVPSGSPARRMENYGPVCPVCQRDSEPGQKFCGVCGAPLVIPAEAGKHDRAFLGNNSIPSFTPVSPQGDAQWLRDKAFAGFDADTPKRQVWKYLVPVIVVVVAGLGYLGWSGRSHPAQAPKPTAAVPSEAKVESNKPEADKPSNVTPANPQSERTSISKPKSGKVESYSNPNSRTAGATLAVERQKLSPTSTESNSGRAPGKGSQELLTARHYLDGKGATRDTPEAAKWLWKAVSKQNTSAVTLLADLYIRGDGVPKNCDQARLLLAAAAKKGNNQAAEKLRTLESDGCL